MSWVWLRFQPRVSGRLRVCAACCCLLPAWGCVRLNGWRCFEHMLLSGVRARIAAATSRGSIRRYRWRAGWSGDCVLAKPAWSTLCFARGSRPVSALPRSLHAHQRRAHHATLWWLAELLLFPPRAEARERVDATVASYHQPTPPRLHARSTRRILLTCGK
jgi:hypothetical protein